jgi:hypothetical protein
MPKLVTYVLVLVLQAKVFNECMGIVDCVLTWSVVANDKLVDESSGLVTGWSAADRPAENLK